jgi:hypothetical protein
MNDSWEKLNGEAVEREVSNAYKVSPACVALGITSFCLEYKHDAPELQPDLEQHTGKELEALLVCCA